MTWAHRRSKPQEINDGLKRYKSREFFVASIYAQIWRAFYQGQNKYLLYNETLVDIFLFSLQQVTVSDIFLKTCEVLRSKL